MKTKPILFQTDLVNKILADEKTETRRLIRSPYKKYKQVSIGMTESYKINEVFAHDNFNTRDVPNPYKCDFLWVKECWKLLVWQNRFEIHFKANRLVDDGTTRGMGVFFDRKPDEYKGLKLDPEKYKWRSSLFLPKWASRLYLKVKDTYPERLRDITEEGAKAEGCSSKEEFKKLWIKINGENSWRYNPPVWVVKFERLWK